MQFSITLDCPPDDNLKRLLSSRRDHISHIYLVNRFRLSTESPEEHSRALAVLCRLVESLHGFNLELVFALDDSCMGGWQLVGAFQERLIITLIELAQLGIKAVSLADPFLAQFFRSPFPPHDDLHSFRLYLGVNAKLTEGCKLRYLDLSQLNLLTLHPRLNRDPQRLWPMVEYISGKAELVANSGCSDFCPREIFCNGARFHGREDNRAGDSPYREECLPELHNRPGLIRELPFILPEHLELYENRGIRSLQILASPHHPDEIARMLEYYLRGRSPENLVDLLYRKGRLPEGLPMIRSESIGNCLSRSVRKLKDEQFPRHASEGGVELGATEKDP